MMLSLTWKNCRISAVELLLTKAAAEVDLVLGGHLDTGEVVPERRLVESDLLNDVIA